MDRPVGNFCSEFEFVFVPQTPTVYIAVDRSTSMFETNPKFWDTLRDGLLPVVESLQADVRFGFSSYTGEQGGSCGLDASPVAIAKDNYGAIASAWNALGQPTHKGETPTSYAVQQAAEILLQDDSPGGRFILLVSDGAPDMCHDSYNSCGVDGTIASLQIAAKQGVQTLVFGIEQAGVTQEVFDAFAQAGVGEAPASFVYDGAELGKYDEHSGEMANRCTSAGIWPSLKTDNAASRNDAGMVESNFQPAGAYSSTPGTAKAFLSSDIAALSAQISSSLAGLKSCQMSLNFDVKDASVGQMYVHDKTTPIPNDQWKLVEGTENVVELMGDACATWQSPEVDYFFAGFPCTAIVVR